MNYCILNIVRKKVQSSSYQFGFKKNTLTVDDALLKKNIRYNNLNYPKSKHRILI